MNSKHASIILKGATIYPGKDLPKDYDYIAISGETILALGKGPVPDEIINSETKVYELDKNLLITAGFHDNHVHLVLAGMLDKYINLDGCKSRSEVADKVKTFADTIPREHWIIGFGFSRFQWDDSSIPTKETLDAVIPDRPVLLMDNELHSAWVNNKSLEIAGITSATKDPDYGEIGRFENGEPNGFLYESALTLVAKLAFDFTEEIAIDLIKRYMKTANSYGITSASDMTPYLGIDMSYYDAYKSLIKNGELTVRINAARDLFKSTDIFTKLKLQTDAMNTNMYSQSYYKQFVDGVPSNYTAMMLEDYSNCKGEKGKSLLPLSELNDAVINANKHNIPVRLHACGDGAVRLSLDAFEKSIRNLNGDIALDNDSNLNGYQKGFIRNQIEHIEVIDEDDIERFCQLGVIASVQPEHIVSGIDSHNENEYPELLGPKREKFTWPFKSLLNSGAILAMGSDMPVVPGVPFEGLYVGLERVHNDGTPEGGWNPSEKLSISELIDGYTSGAAFAEGKEDSLGTLEPGKFADLAVFSNNLLDSPSDVIRNAKAVITIVNGTVVYETKRTT